ncbi:MAG: hypothetical protein ACLQNE_33150 [Thermoguttaceae bacterium]
MKSLYKILFVVCFACSGFQTGLVLPCRAAEPRAPSAPDRAAIPAKILRHAQRLMKQYDTNGDGRLQTAEWRKMPGDLRAADADGDGVITLNELTQWLYDYGLRHPLRPALAPPGAATESPPLLDPATPKAGETEADRRVQSGAGEQRPADTQPATADKPPADPTAGPPDRSRPVRPDVKFHVPASRLPPGLPAWFLERDLDGDGQLTFSEFAPHPTPELIEEFRRYDLNGDGVITAAECLRAMGASKAKAPPKTTPP